MGNYKIYMHVNKNNNKKYIGQTKQTLKERWGSDGRRYKGQAFYNAIQKYGWDNFEHILILDNLSHEEANYYEQYFIQQYQTTDKKFGYNVQKGGNTNTLNENQKEKRRQLNYQMWEDGTFKEIINTPVFCVELNKIFNSAAEAGKELEIDPSAIRKVIRGKNKTAGGFHWIEKKELISIGSFKKE